jgi:hypothetical protein
MVKGNPEMVYNLIKRHFGEKKPRCKNNQRFGWKAANGR